MQVPSPSCVRHQSKTGHGALLTPAQARMPTTHPCSLCFLAQAASEAPQLPAFGFPQVAVPPPALTSACLQKGSSPKGDTSVLQLSTCCSLRTSASGQAVLSSLQNTKHTPHSLAFIRPYRLQFSLKRKLTVALILSAVQPPRSQCATHNN